MKRKLSRLVPCCLLFAVSDTAQESAQALPDDHCKWLEEEVVYITEREKEVFLLLKTREERDRTIEGVWRRRDPILVAQLSCVIGLRTETEAPGRRIDQGPRLQDWRHTFSRHEGSSNGIGPDSTWNGRYPSSP